MEIRKERRKSRRYHVRKGVYAVLTPFYEVMGPIINISRTGLAFCYHPLEDYQGQDLLNNKELIELSIISDIGDFFCDGIRIKIISDDESDHYSKKHQLRIKRCGLMFEHADNGMRLKLENLIKQLAK